jgi:hypothetical protein
MARSLQKRLSKTQNAFKNQATNQFISCAIGGNKIIKYPSLYSHIRGGKKAI